MEKIYLTTEEFMDLLELKIINGEIKGWENTKILKDRLFSESYLNVSGLDKVQRALKKPELIEIVEDSMLKKEMDIKVNETNNFPFSRKVMISVSQENSTRKQYGHKINGCVVLTSKKFNPNNPDDIFTIGELISLNLLDIVNIVTINN